MIRLKVLCMKTPRDLRFDKPATEMRLPASSITGNGQIVTVNNIVIRFAAQPFRDLA